MFGARALFLLIALFCLAPLAPIPPEVLGLVAPGALVAGIAIGLTIGNPFAAQSKRVSRTLLQASVVLLGFSMDLQKVLHTGAEGIVFALVSISAVYAAGWALQKVLDVRSVTSLLVSTGTAICGGSAIAAISSVVDAPEEDVSVAVGTVFILNAIALLIFPPLGHALGLSQTQFGMWAGIAIHDIASVVGAGTSYGPQALDVATAVKLSRVLYLVPITLIVAYLHHRANREEGRKSTMQIPWFIGLFLLASAIHSLVPSLAPLTPWIKKFATCGFALSLFLIGAGVSRKTLKQVGFRPLAQGVALWVLISVAGLFAVRSAKP